MFKAFKTFVSDWMGKVILALAVGVILFALIGGLTH